MKTLDGQVPSGYFDALPNKVLARLEGNMQSTTGTTSEKREPEIPPPAVETKQTEDSGLHDIRSLAQSTKQRLSKRGSVAPPIKDEDVLAASSAGWKAVALPEPAKMVSLPALDELPSASEVKQQAKELKAQEKAARKAAAAAAVDLPIDLPGAAPTPARPAFGAHMATRKKSKAPLAIGGVLLAAAAGVAIYMTTQGGAKSEDKIVAQATPVVAAEAPKAPAPTPPPPPPVQAAAAPEAVADTAAAGSAPAEEAKDQKQEVVAKADLPSPKPSKHVATKGKGGGKAALAKPEPEQQVAPPPVEKKPADDKKAKGGKDGEGEPSFDALLKEAGVDETKKQAKPKLANKSLSGSDFKAGMSAVAGKAQGCYKGTQGTAMVKMSVAPSGQVTSVTVTGAFAGKPEASCVESAVKSAHFPAWDGGPQTFTYSYLLAE